MKKTGLSLGVEYLLMCLLVFVLISFKTYSQEAPSSSQEQISLPNIEKIYLHTDRNYYTLGESLWYKAYSVYAYNNLLFNNSNVLYVELISPDSKIIARHKTKLVEGLGNGDFKLTDSTGVKKPGTYQLRAYTNWSRNFDDDFVFNKEIKILDAFNEESTETNVLSEGTEKSKSSNETKEATKNNIKVQFFPEGGSLIENVSSMVAFKAVNKQGIPVKVKGKILDSNNILIALFASVHDGMGQFKLKPVKGEHYHAVITSINADNIEIPLPKANEQGYLLSYKKLKGRDIVSIKTNKETVLQHGDTPLVIRCATRGITYFESKQPLKNTLLSFELPKSELPEGISQITLYDADLKPQSERLIYVEKDQDLEVTLTTNKSLYKPNEKVDVTVSSKTKTGEVLPASFSLSSTDTNGVEAKDYGMNIYSYFLMQSDIKGKVYNPSYYFDDSNTDRLRALDLLLLTQGWRDFLWKTVPKVTDSITYNVEKGITISGKVKQLLGKKSKENSTVTLTLMNEKDIIDLESKLTDNEGRFSFENLAFSGKVNMLLKTKDKNGKNGGMFVLDSLQLSPMNVNFKNNGIIHTPENKKIKENVYKKHVLFGVPSENVLEEVEIIAKKKDNIPSLYGHADRSYVVDDTKHNNALDIFQMIQRNIPGVRAFNFTVGFNRYQGALAHVIIDGVSLDQKDLVTIQPDEVAKIEAFVGTSTAIFGPVGANGVIVIYRKTGGGKNALPVFHTIKKEIEGYYEARVFYSPDLENLPSEIYTKESIRNTLYWNPYIHPDAAGIKTETYYNSSIETKVKVTLEGITATGIPVALKTFYTIEK
ncbi:hypothetical protein [Thalassobellus citreus]|uniref:hypothetical protein n=1 Tax=Thalassobellus citreus TaxID=3367752 RepID=UPI00379EC52C